MARPLDPRIDRAIVEACVDLLGEIGRSELTRAKIADRAGVSLPAVNRRFPDVGAVLREVARTPGSAPASQTAPAPTSLREYLCAVVGAMSRAFESPTIRRAAAELLAAAAGDDVLDAVFQETLTEVRREGLDRVRRAQAAGEVRTDADPDAVLDLVVGSVYYRLVWRGVAIGAHEVEPLVDLLLGGLGSDVMTAPSTDS